MHTFYSEPLKVFITNPQQFDWNSFLWGGAVGSFLGAFIILGIERVLDYVLERRRHEKEHNQISAALNTEIDNNLSVCNTIIEKLSKFHQSIYNFAKFENIWIDKYSTKFIDYTNDDSIRLYSFLYGAKALIGQIHTTQNIQLTLSVAGRALSSFRTLAENNNKAVLGLTKELKAILDVLKTARKGNKIYKVNLPSNVMQ